MTARSLLPLIALVLLAGCQETPPLSDEPTGIDGGSVAPVELTYGAPVPDFTLKDPAGASISLSSFRGKVVLIDFWATWCAPCLSSVPDLKSLWQKYKTKDFVMLSVSLDRDIPGWKSYIRDSGMDWVHVLDTRGSTSPTYLYGVNAIPTAMLIDRDGNFLDMSHSAQQLDEAIASQLK